VTATPTEKHLFYDGCFYCELSSVVVVVVVVVVAVAVVVVAVVIVVIVVVKCVAVSKCCRS